MRGGDNSSGRSAGTSRRFQSTPPHARGRHDRAVVDCLRVSFQSTPPHARGRLMLPPRGRPARGFQSTPPHARGRPALRRGQHSRRMISIHAPSCEGATQKTVYYDLPIYISIHAPSCEGATFTGIKPTSRYQFQSTPPHARGRLKRLFGARVHVDFNPRPLMRGGDR